MAYYEQTIVAKQDLAEKEIKSIKDKYNDIINDSVFTKLKYIGI